MSNIFSVSFHLASAHSPKICHHTDWRYLATTLQSRFQLRNCYFTISTNSARSQHLFLSKLATIPTSKDGSQGEKKLLTNLVYMQLSYMLMFQTMYKNIKHKIYKLQNNIQAVYRNCMNMFVYSI